MSPTRLRARLTYVGAVIALLIAPASAQNGSQFRDWKSSVLGDAAPIEIGRAHV